MSEISKEATEALVDALERRSQDSESLALDALEAHADPNALAKVPGMVVQRNPVRLPALAVAAVLGNQVIARGLLQSGASVARAQEALVNAAREAERDRLAHRRLMLGLVQLGAVLNVRILDLERYGRSPGPFAEPERPRATSLIGYLQQQMAPGER